MHIQDDLLPSEEANNSTSLSEIESFLNDDIHENIASTSEDCTIRKISFSYWAGFVCKNVQEDRNSSEKELASNLWIRLKDIGGLCYPNQEYLSLLSEFEVCFYTVHENKICLQPNVVKNFISLLNAKYPNVPPKLIAKYSKARLFLRLKYLQKCLDETKSSTETRRGRNKKRQLSK